MPVVDLKGQDVGALRDAAVNTVHFDLNMFEVAFVGFFTDKITVHFHAVGVVSSYDDEPRHVNGIGWNHHFVLKADHAVVTVAVGRVPDPMSPWDAGVPSRVGRDFKRPLPGRGHRCRGFTAVEFHHLGGHVVVTLNGDDVKPRIVLFFLALDTIVGILVGIDRVNVASVVEHDLLNEGSHLNLNGVGPEFLTVLHLSVSPSFVAPISIQATT